MSQPEKYCEGCGAPFTDTKHPEKRFCSRYCAQRYAAPRRKGSKGFVVSKKGYILIRAMLHPMASKEGYVMQHRLVMAEHLGRNLTADEVVHHINGIKSDNRIENLVLLTKKEHDCLPKPPKKPIICPHCGGGIVTSGRVREVRKL